MRAFIIFLFLAATTAQSQASELSARLDKIVRSHSLPRQNLGLVVMDLANQPASQVFGLNEQQEFIPASITKLATAAAVLQRLGPSFKFQTSLWSEAPVKNSVLQGDLILHGGGDTGFVSESMWFLVNELMRTGIQKIDGNLVVDDSDFDSVRADPSRDPERVDRAYDAPVGAMSFNWNSVNIYVRPTQVGQPPNVYLDPLTEYYKIENSAKTVAGSGSSLEYSRKGPKIVVAGSIGVAHDEAVAYKNVDDPADWSGRNLLFFLGQRGVAVTGSVKAGKKPAEAKLLAKADSKPVSQHVIDMMKFSNNYIAEMLTKDLAAQNGEHPATLDGGMQLIRANLERIGIESKRFTLLNPSGLSRHNRMRARDLAEILVAVQKSFPIFAELLTALPMSGLDGTLKKRMGGAESVGWVRAKTGSLAGVVSLAGYVGKRDGTMKAFAFIFNGKADQGDAARHLFDALAEALIR